VLKEERKNLYPSLRSCLYSFILSILLFLNLSVAIPAPDLTITPSPLLFATTDSEEEGEEQEEEEQEAADQQQPPEESLGAQPLPQQVPQTQPLPEQLLGAQQQQPPLESFILGGRINSLLPVGNDTWIAEGNWNMVADGGEPKSFTSQMTWTSADGTTSHTHELQNFELTGNGTDIVMSPTDTIILEGEVDVGTNGVINWEDVPVSMYFGNGQTIAVSLDDQATNSHFGGQAVFGLVTATTPCGSTPGPGMQILPLCE
jgi:hypothetical protein